MPAKLLIIEDSPSMLHMYQGFLQKEPFQLLKAETGKAGLRILRDQRPELLLLDLKLPDLDGQQILELIAAERLGTTTIVMTAHGSINVAVDAMRLGANDFLVKPFAQERLVQTLHNAVELRQLKTKVAVYQQLDRPSYDEMIGSSLAMQAVYRTIDSAAPSDATVFITGETGTGKELVARALHDLGSRRAGPFVPINMAAIPRNLVESELFGHEKGAFVGADSRMSGRFEQAEGGSLFLDEVGDMPPEAQTRLLRVLQDGEYLAVGANRPVKANVRIIAATNQNLQHLMQQGLFREDLFYRLNFVPLRLPPLRERVEDIAPLVNHFLKQAMAGGLPEKRFSPDGIRALASWNWPGNVRELENLVRRLLVLVGDDVISAEMVEAELAAVREVEAEPIEVESLSNSVDQHIRRYFDALEGAQPAPGLHARILREVEYPLIVATLELTRGNQVKAAEILGINRNTLRKRIRELGIWSGR